jgi:hypothetical protein
MPLEYFVNSLLLSNEVDLYFISRLILCWAMLQHGKLVARKASCLQCKTFNCACSIFCYHFCYILFVSFFVNIGGNLFEERINQSDFFLLTPWRKVLLEKMIVAQLVKRFPFEAFTVMIQVEVFWVVAPCSGRIPTFHRSMVPPSSGWSDLWIGGILPQHYMASLLRGPWLEGDSLLIVYIRSCHWTLTWTI